MFFIIKHPLIEDKLTGMRKKDTPSVVFRNSLNELTKLLAYEATKHFTTLPITINTPLKEMVGNKLENEIVVVPILRAGLGMADALMDLMPNCSVGFIGLYRDENNLTPIKYYEKMPQSVENSNVLICDPMIATANSICSAIQILEKYKPKTITVLGIVACTYGLNKLTIQFPHIPIYVAANDSHLNEEGYIVPGLGDAGDRIYKTK